VDAASPSRVRLARRGAGFAAWGPGFYVWDEDPREVVRVAADLAGAGREPEDPGGTLHLPLPAADPI
jgi:hypothetical protein